MKSLFTIVVVILIFCTMRTFGQSASNYTFSTSLDGSLTDMSTGTIQLVAPNTDGLGTGIFSSTNDIGFTFYFMSMPYDQFVVTEDGVLRLGTSLAAINRTPELDMNEPRLIAFSSDMGVGQNGKVHYKTIGVTPNRICVVEWLNNYATFPAAMPVNGLITFQIRLHETTGQIEYVYGYFNMQRRRDNSDLGGIGFCNTNANNGMMYKTGTFSNSNVGTTTPSTNLCRTNILATGEVAGLSSTTDGARRVYSFTPPIAPAAPTGLTFTGITQSTMTLNWTDNATNETHYHVWRSDDGGLTYDLALILPANSTTSGVINGLPDKTYLWKIYAVNEGQVSTALEGSCNTLAAGLIHSTPAGGLWSQVTTWEGGILPTSNDDVVIRDGATVRIDINTAVCNNLSIGEGISGTLRFMTGATSGLLTVDGDVEVKAGGVFDVEAGVTAGTRKIIIGQRTYANGHLTVNGTFDMSCGGSNTADVEFRGLVNGAVSGTGATCDFFKIIVNKGTNAEKYIDIQRVITLYAPTAAGSQLVIQNGTFRLSSASNLTPWYGAQTLCPATGRIWLNNTNAILRCVGTGTATGAGNPTLNGKLHITSGIFGYGSGNNTFQVNGTVLIDGADGLLEMYGRMVFANTAYLNFYDGELRMDPQAGANLAAGNVFEFGTTSFVTFTGGRLVFVDPKNYAASSDFYIPGSGEQNKTFTGSTISYGNGISSTGGSASGFTHTSPTDYGMYFGDIEIDNPAGANRFVRFTRASGGNPICFENATVFSGTMTFNGVTITLGGNLINNGTLDVSTAASGLKMEGASAQTISGTGTQSATNNLTFTINNSAGVTLAVPFNTLTLTLTLGKLSTTSTNLISVIGTATTNITGGSATSYVNGPLRWTITGGGAGTFRFPVGKSAYNLFEMLNPVTAASTVITAEVFDADCGGTISLPNELNTNRYWSVIVSSGSFTSGTVRITETNPTTNLQLAQCATVNGTYTLVHGSQAGNTLTSSALTSLDYFCAAAPAFLSGTYTVGTGQPFTSLTNNNAQGFFRAVNSAGLKGNVILRVTSDLAESGTVALNQWAEINGSGFTLSIVPDDASVKNIIGNVGDGMIRLNGADRVTIDGKSGGSGKYLLFRNQNAGYNVITFINEATYNTLTDIIVESNNTSANNARRGVVLFSTSTAAGSLGNSYNTVTNCNLRNRSDLAGNPSTGIYSYGTLAKLNKENIIEENNLFNTTTDGINISNTGNGDGWIIDGNSFYNDAALTTAYTGVVISLGAGHEITNNYFGGTSSTCGGGALTITGDVTYRAISLSVAAGTATSVQGNTISNINMTNAGGSTYFFGIQIIAGPVNIGTLTGNTIGHASTANSIISAGQRGIIGISNASTSSVTIWNNTIANMYASSNHSNSCNRGIQHTGTGSSNIADNTVFNLSANSTRTSGTDMSVQGIYYGGASAGSCLITENLVYNLSNINNTAISSKVAGITVHQVSNPTINRNRIYNISNSSTGVTVTDPPVAAGIVVCSPAATSVLDIRNNIISLGSGLTTNTQFNGIWLNSNTTAYTVKIYYNTIVLTGTVSAGALNSFALLRGNNSTTTLTSVTVEIDNNILVNARSGGTGSHFAIGNQGTAPATGWNSAASDYNLLVSSASTTVGYWNATGYNIANWKTNSGGDPSSLSATSVVGASNATQLNISNLFTDPAAGDLTIRSNQPEAWYVNGKGKQMLLANDFEDDPRSTDVTAGSTDIGADECNVTSTPISCVMSGSIADGNTTSFTFGGRTVASIQWHGSTFPASVDIKLYSQTDPPTTDGFGTPYPGISGSQFTNCYWDINATGGNINNYNYDLSLSYDPAMIGTIDDESAMSIGKNPYYYPTAGDMFDDYGKYGTTVNTGNHTADIDGVIGFSLFSLLKNNNITLPVNLVSFSGTCFEEEVVLEWVTASEINNSYFTLEKSTDAIEFMPIAIVEGAGTTNDVSYYTLMDEDAFNEGRSLYYRLKQTDFDGKSTMSEMIVVKCAVNDIDEFRIGTTPDQIIVYFSGEEGQEYTVYMTDNLGRVIITSKLMLDNKYGEVPVGISGLAAGTYNVVVTSDYSVKSKQVLIMR